MTHTLIKNGRAYPEALKKAALKASKAKKATVASVANDFNISKATLGAWRRQAGIQGPTPSGIARHIQASVAVKAYNTIKYISILLSVILFTSMDTVYTQDDLIYKDIRFMVESYIYEADAAADAEGLHSRDAQGDRPAAADCRRWGRRARLEAPQADAGRGQLRCGGFPGQAEDPAVPHGRAARHQRRHDRARAQRGGRGLPRDALPDPGRQPGPDDGDRGTDPGAGEGPAHRADGRAHGDRGHRAAD